MSTTVTIYDQKNRSGLVFFLSRRVYITSRIHSTVAITVKAIEIAFKMFVMCVVMCVGVLCVIVLFR